jgi:hypothetical protein
VEEHCATSPIIVIVVACNMQFDKQFDKKKDGVTKLQPLSTQPLLTTMRGKGGRGRGRGRGKGEEKRKEEEGLQTIF